ncbi:MAG TPA: hypothetical protein VLM37_05025 [Fibrobacteraceae bacterium]|nr:hypothetical protein [Fibrobacteraceae bacterium]
MAKEKDIPASIDARGFLRFVAESTTDQKAFKFPFVNIFVDPIGRRVALELVKTEKPGSFRIVNHDGRRLVFIKGAINKAKGTMKAGSSTLSQEGSKYILSLSKTTKAGAWQFFPCRNSPSIPMASLDSRGTLILDRNCTSSLGIPVFNSADVDFDKRTNKMSLDFKKDKGQLNVRSVGTHANISLMGSLRQNGKPLPKSSIRLVCEIKNHKLKFSVAGLR